MSRTSAPADRMVCRIGFYPFVERTDSKRTRLSAASRAHGLAAPCVQVPSQRRAGRGGGDRMLLTIRASVSSTRAGGPILAWGWGPTRAGGGGVPARNQVMLTPASSHLLT